MFAQAESLVGWLIAAIGLFTMVCAAADFYWFMNSRKAQLLVGILGRRGARIFYILLGLTILVVSGLVLSGVIQDV